MAASIDPKRLIRAYAPRFLYEAARRMKLAMSSSDAGPKATDPAAAASPPKKIASPLGFSPRNSFAEATAECGDGYGEMLTRADKSSVATLTDSQDYAAPVLASIAVAALKSKKDRIRVLDFGGGAGAFRAYVNTFFEGRFLTEWVVVETAEQVRHNSDVSDDDLKFSAEIGSVPYDFAMFSGSLQYVGDWQARLRETKADMILILRTPLYAKELPFVQTISRDGRSYRVPGRVISLPEMTALLEKTHHLFASWKFEAHLFEMGIHATPAMLWMRKPPTPAA